VNTRISSSVVAVAWALALALVLFAAPGVARAQFVGGKVYALEMATPFGARDVTAGGNVSGAPLLPLPERCPGQAAWSLDRSVMYVTLFDTNRVVTLTSAGVMGDHATGISGPTGLLMTTDGQLLVVSWYDGAVYNVTTAGDFSAAASFATGGSDQRNLIQLADGRILLASQGSGEVFEVPYPGGGAGSVFAWGFTNPQDFAEDAAGNLYVSDYGSQSVIEISAGGDFSSAVPHVTGHVFQGLTIANGLLLAVESSGTQIYEITTPGTLNVWATGLSSTDTGLDTVPMTSTCGDGTTEPGEQCDDGNTIDGDGCSALCQLEICGNSTIDASEVCDDGNTVDGDGCSADCLSDETCGNGLVDAPVGEQCDDGNVIAGDGCSADCLSDETCGNGIVDVAVGEECDDGNTVDGDGCQASCALPGCGDGVLDGGEVCDDGNAVDGDGCSADCLSDETCGNGVVDTAVGEACDDGNIVDGDGCQSNCALPACGDGTLDVGEVCDDGNTADGDGCSATCTSDESCGNGVLDGAAGELCDDGNQISGDGCSASCAVEYCGDGVVNGGERCDDGNLLDGDGCSADCQSDETCGNGVVDVAAGEACDDGAANDDDVGPCATTCQLVTSGPVAERGGCGCTATKTGLPVFLFPLLILGWLLRRRRPTPIR